MKYAFTLLAMLAAPIACSGSIENFTELAETKVSNERGTAWSTSLLAANGHVVWAHGNQVDFFKDGTNVRSLQFDSQRARAIAHDESYLYLALEDDTPSHAKAGIYRASWGGGDADRISTVRPTGTVAIDKGTLYACENSEAADPETPHAAMVSLPLDLSRSATITALPNNYTNYCYGVSVQGDNIVAALSELRGQFSDIFLAKRLAADPTESFQTIETAPHLTCTECVGTVGNKAYALLGEPGSEAIYLIDKQVVTKVADATGASAVVALSESQFVIFRDHAVVLIDQTKPTRVLTQRVSDVDAFVTDGTSLFYVDRTLMGEGPEKYTGEIRFQLKQTPIEEAR